jgi:ferredoxin
MLMLFSTVGSVLAAARNREGTFRKLWCGYGACSQCACQAYQGNDNLCTNCAHKYEDHS